MIAPSEVTVGGHATRTWLGGRGEPLLLLHGAWGGAEMHWAPVWDDLATVCRVIAPDFPGLAQESAWVPDSLEASAEWVEGVLDATGENAAWIAGNSFGAAVASRVACRSPERCRGLILIDGGPPPNLPTFITRLLRRQPLRRAVEGALRRSAYSSATLARAFADPARTPAGVREVIGQRRPRQLLITSEIVLAGDRPLGFPHVRTLVIWGAEDRLLGNTVKAGHRLARSLPNARLEVIPDAGHLPQVEQPEHVARIVREFVRERS